jgi:hypothetical protein
LAVLMTSMGTSCVEDGMTRASIRPAWRLDQERAPYGERRHDFV